MKLTAEETRTIATLNGLREIAEARKADGLTLNPREETALREYTEAGEAIAAKYERIATAVPPPRPEVPEVSTDNEETKVICPYCMREFSHG